MTNKIATRIHNACSNGTFPSKPKIDSLNALIAYVMGEYGWTAWKKPFVNWIGNVPSLAPSCKTNSKIPRKFPALSNAVTKKDKMNIQVFEMTKRINRK